MPGKACVKPPASAHVTITTEGNMVGDRAWYQCEPGYKMVGRSPITCTDQPGFALWDDVFPRCFHIQKRSEFISHSNLISVVAISGQKCSLRHCPECIYLLFARSVTTITVDNILNAYSTVLHEQR